MRKFMLFISLMVAMTSTVFAQIDTNKEYRLKHVASDCFLNAANYDAHPTGATGGVNVVAKADSDDQVFTFEEAESGYYLKTKSGYYIFCQSWNVDALENGSVLTFTDAGNGQYYIMNGSKYFKVENVSGTYYPFCDAALGAAAKWIILENGNETAEAKINLQAAIDNADAYTIGEKFGEFSSSDADYATKVQAIKDFYASIDADTTVEEINSKIEELNALIATLTQNTELVEGKYYVLSCPIFATQMGVYSDGTNARWKTFDAADISFYWTVETTDNGKVLKNANNNKYLLGATANETIWSMVETAAGAEATLISCGSGQFYISINGRHMHAADHGEGTATAGRIVSWETNTANSASSWRIIESALPETCAITYVFQYEGTTVETQEAVAMVGGEYPDFTLTAPYGVTATKPEGTVSGDETVVIELTVSKALPFEAVASGTPTKWYYAQIHGNFPSYMVSNGIGAEMAWKVNGEVISSIDEANADSYTWGFVGDLWTGFKMVNKAGGAIKSTGSGNVTIVEDLAEATAFIAMAPSTGDNAAAETGFCLLNADADQYINAQNVGLNHWTAPDAGSTIVVTEREIEVVVEALVPTSVVRTNKAVEYKLAGVQLTFDENITATTPENGEYGYVLNANDEKVLVFDKISGGSGTGKFATFQNSVYGTAVETAGEYTVVITTVLTGESGKVYNGGEYAFTVTKRPVEISRDVEFWGNTVEEMPLDINITISYADAITLDDTKKVTYVTGETTYEAVVTKEENVINIAFDENVEYPEGAYTFNIPAGLYTVNGEANEAVSEEFTYKKAVPVKIVSVHPEAGTVENIEFITIEFNQALNVADMCNYQIYFNGYYLIQEESYGESTTVSYYVSGADADGYATYEATTITAPGEYTLYAGDLSSSITWAEDQQESYTWTIKEAVAFEVTAQTPAADEVVESLSSITIEFTKDIVVDWGTDAGTGGTGAATGTTDATTGGTGGSVSAIKIKDANGGVAATIWTSTAVVDGNKLTFNFDAITATGTYTIELPAGCIKSVDGEEYNGGTFTFNVEEAVAFEVAAQTPAADEVVESLSSITIEFTKDIVVDWGTDAGTGTTDAATGGTGSSVSAIKIKDANGGIAAYIWTSTAVVDGNKLTFNFDAITATGTYTIELPAGCIKSVDGEEYNGGTFTFQVEEATVEPEPETPSGLNETVIFDFANNNWGIPTMAETNYNSIKTAGEYTDGTKTINIDPTANGGSYIYDSKGFLNISKPGTKITLPAFGFAVEKIEVVGHSSATGYPNVDMNVYVGETAVSAPCIGSTATSTFEIAAENQAAGNVYELVIGSNGGAYSSVMYITYIKVYPAENKLEAPVIDLASGVYVGEQTVNVHSATADIEGVTNVTYYYTTDGNEPTVEDEETDGEITITGSCTLKVVVELTYGDKTYVSASTSAEYIISEAITYHRAVDVESGNYFLAANGHVAAPLANGVLPAVETTINGNDLTEAAYYAITLEEAAEAGTYYIKDVNGNYIYTSSMYGTSGPKLSSNGAYTPMSSWTITIADDENSSATIVSEGLTLVFDTVAGAFKVTESVTEDMVLPTFYGTHATGIENAVINGEAIESIYDLQGRKLEKITEGGIYIVNGKKVYVK